MPHWLKQLPGPTPIPVTPPRQADPMTDDVRRIIYERQTGSPRPTPKQRSRRRHKTNRKRVRRGS